MAKRFRSASRSRTVRRRLNFGTRPVRRSRMRRSGRVKSWTTQSGSGKTMGYKSRRVSGRAWRRHLWRTTLAETHYRSTGNGASAIVTGTTVGQGVATLFYPTFIGVAGPTTAFWTAAGGLVEKDVGASVVTFPGSDLVIRGGQIGITISAPDTVTDDCNVKIFTVRLVSRPNVALLAGATPYGTMIDSEPDFNKEFGKILDVKEATINYNNPSMTVVRRLGVQKIDIENYGTTLGSQIIFVVVATNMIDATANTLSAIIWHDMSFTGDAVTGTV